MAKPSISDLKMWVGTLFTKDDWDFNFSKIVSWFADGTSDLVVGSLKAPNGLDLDGAQIINVGPATTGTQAINLDQAETLLHRSNNYIPFSVASGKADSNGVSAYLQKDSDTQVTVLAGNTNPDLVCILSDGTIESVTSNTILTVPATDGTYHIIKEKKEDITLTAGTSGIVTVSKKYPTSPNIGDYFLNNSASPFKGYKYTASGWEETEFCYLGDVKVSSGTTTVTGFPYNYNWFNVNKQSFGLIMPDYSAGTDVSAYNSSSNLYTAPCDGYFIGEAVSVTGGNARMYLVIKAPEDESVTVLTIGNSDLDPGVGNHGRASVAVPIPKGYKFYSDSLGTYSVAKIFYPLKGVSNA